ncbi:MAG: ATP-binding cassette domain-containing protein, partial [Gammaproteobacteria bacterium]|nr:ATP-binding cassette domain-containing protein [Gammaproteobacteria bacterium]
ALKQQGVTIILITHKLREIMAVTDYVSVMRRGAMVAHMPTETTSESQLAEHMVGRKVLLDVQKASVQAGEVLLKVKQLNWSDSQGVPRLKNINFDIRAGEVLGVAGVSGNGQSELLEVLSGIAPIQEGSVDIKGQTFSAKQQSSAAQMRSMGMAHVPEDRHKKGMIMDFSAAETAVLGYHTDAELSNGPWLKPALVQQRCAELMQAFDVRPDDVHLKSANFSGGNQQKLILAREMEHSPDVLLIGQPTRGVDVGAIEFIHQRILAMRDAGKAVLLVSVELEEILSLSDRIMVLCDGEITGRMAAEDADERTLGMLMANAHQAHDPLQPTGQGEVQA